MRKKVTQYLGLISLGILIVFSGCEGGPQNNEADNTPTVMDNVDSTTPTPLSITETATISKTIYVPTATREIKNQSGTVVPGGTISAGGTVSAGGVTATSGPRASQYQYVSQNFADNTKLAPGVLVTITWAIKNVGTVGWTSAYSLNYFSGVQGKKNSIPFPPVTGVGKTLNISVNFVTPTTPGTYSTWWKLTDDKGQNFGDVDFTFIVT